MLLFEVSSHHVDLLIIVMIMWLWQCDNVDIDDDYSKMINGVVIWGHRSSCRLAAPALECHGSSQLHSQGLSWWYYRWYHHQFIINIFMLISYITVYLIVLFITVKDSPYNIIVVIFINNITILIFNVIVFLVVFFITVKGHHHITIIIITINTMIMFCQHHHHGNFQCHYHHLHHFVDKINNGLGLNLIAMCHVITSKK